MIFVLFLFSLAFSLKPNSLYHQGHSLNRLRSLYARRGIETKSLAPTFTVGENIPEEVAKLNAIYDMVLVERYSAPEKTVSGLFLPKVEGKDQKHLGKIISMPTEYGLESEQGRLQSVDEIMPYKLGDTIYIRVGLFFLWHCLKILLHFLLRIHGVSDQQILKLESGAFHFTRPHK